MRKISAFVRRAVFAWRYRRALDKAATMAFDSPDPYADIFREFE